MARLTKAQRDVLRQLGDQPLFGLIGWPVTSGLIRRGFVAATLDSEGIAGVTITPAGLAALAEAEGKGGSNG